MADWVSSQWTNKEANINNIESASKELAKAQYNMCKTDCNNSSDNINTAKMRLKYEDGVNKVSKEFNSTNRLQNSEKPQEIGKQKFTKQEEDKVKTINPGYDRGPENLDEKLSGNVCRSILDNGWGDENITYFTYEAYAKKLSVKINDSLDSAITRIRGILPNDPRIQFNKIGYSDSRLDDLANRIEERRDNILARTEFTSNPFTLLDDYVARMLRFPNAERMRIELKWLHNNQEVFCR